MTTNLLSAFLRIADSVRLTRHATTARLSGGLSRSAKALADAVEAVGNARRERPTWEEQSRALGALADLIRGDEAIHGGATPPDQWDGAELGPVTLHVDGFAVAVIDTFARHVREAKNSRDLAIAVADMLK